MGVIAVAYLRSFLPADRVALPVAGAGRDIPRFAPGVLTTESQEADAWEVEWDGRLWRCARMARRRRLEAVVAYHRATERFGSGMVSGSVAASARRELGQIAVDSHSPAPVLVAPWAPPIRWFLAFDPSDRVEAMVYRTAAPAAVGRLDEVASLIRSEGLPEILAIEHEELGEWIVGSEGEMLELDYREPGRLLGEVEAAMDESVLEMANSIRSLEESDIQRATDWYIKVARRWAAAQALTINS